MKKLLFALGLFALPNLAEAACPSTLTSCPSPSYNVPNAYEYNLGGNLVINSSGVYVGTGVNVGSGSISGGAITGSSLSAGSGTVTGGAGTLSSLNGAAIGATTPEPGHFTSLYSSGAFTPTGGIAGNTNGASVASGYVGQVITNTSSFSLGGGVVANLTNIVLTAGQYYCSGFFSLGTPTSADTIMEVGITTTSGSYSGIVIPAESILSYTSGIISQGTILVSGSAPVLATSGETLYLAGYSTNNTSGSSATLTCVRTN